MFRIEIKKVLNLVFQFHYHTRGHHTTMAKENAQKKFKRSLFIWGMIVRKSRDGEVENSKN